MIFIGRIHNIVDSSCVPYHTIMVLYRIKHLSLSYDYLQPESHNILMDTKEVWYSTCTTCACVASLGSCGRSKFLCV